MLHERNTYNCRFNSLNDERTRDPEELYAEYVSAANAALHQRCVDEFYRNANSADHLAMRHFKEGDDRIPDARELLARSLFLSGDASSAARRMHEVVELREKQLDQDDVRLGTSYGILGTALVHSYETDKGLDYLQRALEIKVKVHGPDSPELALELEGLARGNHMNEEYDTAIGYYRRLYEILSPLDGVERETLARTCSNLAAMLYQTDNTEAALPYAEKAAAVYDEMGQKLSMDVLGTLETLGTIQDELDKHSEAVDTFLKCADVAQAIAVSSDFEDEPLDRAVNALVSACDVFEKMERYAEMADCALRATMLAEPNPEDPASYLDIALIKLGAAYTALDKHQDAETALERCLRLRKKIYGKRGGNLQTSTNASRGCTLPWARNPRQEEWRGRQRKCFNNPCCNNLSREIHVYVQNGSDPAGDCRQTKGSQGSGSCLVSPGSCQQSSSRELGVLSC